MRRAWHSCPWLPVSPSTRPVALCQGAGRGGEGRGPEAGGLGGARTVKGATARAGGAWGGGRGSGKGGEAPGLPPSPARLASRPSCRLLARPAEEALSLPLPSARCRSARPLAPWRSSCGCCPSPWRWPWALPPPWRAPPNRLTSWCCSTAGSGAGTTGKPAARQGGGGTGWGRQGQSSKEQQAAGGRCSEGQALHEVEGGRWGMTEGRPEADASPLGELTSAPRLTESMRPPYPGLQLLTTDRRKRKLVAAHIFQSGLVQGL